MLQPYLYPQPKNIKIKKAILTSIIINAIISNSSAQDFQYAIGPGFGFPTG